MWWWLTEFGGGTDGYSVMTGVDNTGELVCSDVLPSSAGDKWGLHSSLTSMLPAAVDSWADRSFSLTPRVPGSSPDMIAFILSSSSSYLVITMYVNNEYAIHYQRFESCWITTNTMSSCQQCWWWRVKILKYLKIILFDVTNRCMNEVSTLHKHIKWRTWWTSCEQSTVNRNSWELYVNLGIQMAQQLM